LDKVKGHQTIQAFTPGFLSLDHAAQWADVSVKTIKRWIERGLPKHQAGPRAKVLIRPGDIEVYLTRQQVNAPNLNALVDDVIKELFSPNTS